MCVCFIPTDREHARQRTCHPFHLLVSWDRIHCQGRMDRRWQIVSITVLLFNNIPEGTEAANASFGESGQNLIVFFKILTSFMLT